MRPKVQLGPLAALLLLLGVSLAPEAATARSYSADWGAASAGAGNGAQSSRYRVMGALGLPGTGVLRAVAGRVASGGRVVSGGFFVHRDAWRQSEVWTGDGAGPRDGSAQPWYEPAFDESAWGRVELPLATALAGEQPAMSDRYFRKHFRWTAAGCGGPCGAPVLSFETDDGLAVYVNGALLGKAGGEWRALGCVNRAEACSVNTDVPATPIPTELLREGDNVIAVDVWNAAVEYHADVRLELPAHAAQVPVASTLGALLALAVLLSAVAALKRGALARLAW
ncbi:MAG: hypothetical protein HYV63_11940 [Candidatus Schekmanbacteria bacterium]|nr:hypothetical protein [Candidatus Schekmanbacteria bacterium]